MKPDEREEFDQNLANLYLYLKRELKLKNEPKVVLDSDQKNADRMLGKTGYFNDSEQSIHLFITDRHPKDILRSFSHEVIHFWQHENDKLSQSNEKTLGPTYAQDDPVMRKMEKQAYLLGNILFRDWEDQKKQKDKSVNKKDINI